MLTEFTKKSPLILPNLSFFLHFIFLIRNALRLYEVAYDCGPNISTIITVFTYCVYGASFVGGTYWVIRTVQLNPQLTFTFEEYQCGLYISAAFLYGGCTVGVDAFYGISSWSEANEAVLTIYSFFLLLLVVIVTGARLDRTRSI